MGGEQFAAGRRDFDSHFVVRRNERGPRFADIRLSGRGHDDTIHHCAHDARIRFVISDRVLVAREVDDGFFRWRRRLLILRRRRLCGRPDGAKANQK
ncbi:MAG: hypothetical protein DME57_04835 [Verrucomicrobia bacterium]|nr:MAG: hypothetical protein DME57_04835 [Verrucomicrobiota bacterium]